MCAAFASSSMAWWYIDMAVSDKPRWANKCLQKAIMSMLKGHRRSHATNICSKHCANDEESGHGTRKSADNIEAVVAFLDMYDYHVTLFEKLRHGHVEEFRLGHGNTSLGALLWDGVSRHVHAVDVTGYLDSITTCVSSDPWSRSAVGADVQVLLSNMRLFKPANVDAAVPADGYFLVDYFSLFV